MIPEDVIAIVIVVAFLLFISPTAAVVVLLGGITPIAANLAWEAIDDERRR